MQQQNSSQVLFSASDLVYFLACTYLTALDFKSLTDPTYTLQKDEATESTQLIQEKGFEHEKLYLQKLILDGKDVADLSHLSGELSEQVAATIHAMKAGKEIIYQAALKDDHAPFLGYADFLIRVDTPSKLGTFSYEVIDTKLARSPKTKFLIQLCYYSELIANIQGYFPEKMHLVLGGASPSQQTYHVADFIDYFRNVKSRFLSFLQSDHRSETYPDPCEHCEVCHWQTTCQQQWLTDYHLNQVANIRKTQIKKLNQAGIKTLHALAELQPNQVINGLKPEIVKRLHAQARLQQRKKAENINEVEILLLDRNEKSGFYRIPEPNPGDLFFDMEGDPLEPGGLEYLFGVYYHDNGQGQFKAFWGHDRQQEKRAFEDFIDFATARLAAHPNAYIYHYNHYEVTALQRLMSLHGTRESAVDGLLRRQKFVDLYKVVREGIRVSEPGYSIKNLESFYMADDPRHGEVKNASASIVYYEKWRQTDDENEKDALLESIRAYNEYDCVSTYRLREWLLAYRPHDLVWFQPNIKPEEQNNQQILTEWESKLEDYRDKLVTPLPAEQTQWSDADRVQELLFYLLDFHRRCDKPVWWKLFERQDCYRSGDRESLFADVDCIAEMELVESEPVAKSTLYTFRYPEQEVKFAAGDACVNLDNLRGVNNIINIDYARRTLQLKVRNTNPLPDHLTISKARPINTDALKQGLLRFADAFIRGDSHYPALEALLSKQIPHIQHRSAGTPLIQNTQDITSQVIDVVSHMQQSYLFIQGPPGAGKTYTGSHVIIELLRQGKKVGVSSLSHKAINNLLAAVEKVAQEKGEAFMGGKKSDPAKEETHFQGQWIVNRFDNDIDINQYHLIAGTAYLFARPEFDQQLDYLFVDEAGQIALANLVAMGTSAKNIVLMGDQMQLGQPIQGMHPGDSGKSALEYLLGDEPTIRPERGIFLATTWRMHENVCRFISDTVYDGKLHPEPHNQTQTLILDANAHPTLKATGIRYVPINHDGCSQRSQEEADLINEIYQSLLKQFYRDKQGHIHSITINDVLVLSPYNQQVNCLKQTLPPGVRVGTVDKFQGQEAQVVIISMTTSSGDELPRDIEFLYSKNRLNVSISRAKCLALVVANPALMAVGCKTIEQVKLVNTLCKVMNYT